MSMRGRGQNNFINIPEFGVRVYDALTNIKAIREQHREIAQDLVSRIESGRLLDVGTGPGRLLREIYLLNPNVHLYGLDISSAMVEYAKKGLLDISVDIRQGDILSTDYPDRYFDLVTCTGSFYLWDDPVDCLEEIYRILGNNKSAHLFETYQDFDRVKVRAAIKHNLSKEGLIRRWVAPGFLMHQLSMTYKTEQLSDIIRRTPFADCYSIEKVTLGGLPAWVRIQLTRRE